MTIHEQRFEEVDVDEIEVDSSQPRLSPGDLGELKASIKSFGILQPIILTPTQGNTKPFRILAGERRFTAAKDLNFQKVPAIIRSVEQHERLSIQIVENLHRKDLTVLEEAKGYRRLINEFGLSQAEVGRKFGKSKSSINQTLRILDLPHDKVNAVQMSDRSTKSVLLEIAKFPNEMKRLQLLEQASTRSFTVKMLKNLRKLESKKATSRNRSMSLKVSRGEIILKMPPGYNSVDAMREMLREGLELLGERGRVPDILDRVMNRPIVNNSGEIGAIKRSSDDKDSGN